MDDNNGKKSNSDETEKVSGGKSVLKGHKRGSCDEYSGGNPKIYRPFRHAKKIINNVRHNQSGRKNSKEEKDDDEQSSCLIGGVMCHGRVHSVAQRRQWRRRPF